MQKSKNDTLLIKEVVRSHHMWVGLQIFEVLLLYSRHHPVVVKVLSHFHVIWVGLEERVCSCHCLVQFVDLKNQEDAPVICSK